MSSVDRMAASLDDRMAERLAYPWAGRLDACVLHYQEYPRVVSIKVRFQQLGNGFMFKLFE